MIQLINRTRYRLHRFFHTGLSNWVLTNRVIKLEKDMEEMKNQTSIYTQKLDNLEDVIIGAGECITLIWTVIQVNFSKNKTKPCYVLQMQIISVNDNISDIATDLSKLHEKVENNTIDIEGCSAVKANGKWISKCCDKNPLPHRPYWNIINLDCNEFC